MADQRLEAATLDSATGAHALPIAQRLDIGAFTDLFMLDGEEPIANPFIFRCSRATVEPTPASKRMRDLQPADTRHTGPIFGTPINAVGAEFMTGPIYVAFTTKRLLLVDASFVTSTFLHPEDPSSLKNPSREQLAQGVLDVDTSRGKKWAVVSDHHLFKALPLQHIQDVQLAFVSASSGEAELGHPPSGPPIPDTSYPIPQPTALAPPPLPPPPPPPPKRAKGKCLPMLLVLLLGASVCLCVAVNQDTQVACSREDYYEDDSCESPGLPWAIAALASAILALIIVVDDLGCNGSLAEGCFKCWGDCMGDNSGGMVPGVVVQPQSLNSSTRPLLSGTYERPDQAQAAIGVAHAAAVQHHTCATQLHTVATDLKARCNRATHTPPSCE